MQFYIWSGARPLLFSSNLLPRSTAPSRTFMHKSLPSNLNVDPSYSTALHIHYRSVSPYIRSHTFIHSSSEPVEQDLQRRQNEYFVLLSTRTHPQFSSHIHPIHPRVHTFFIHAHPLVQKEPAEQDLQRRQKEYFALLSTQFRAPGYPLNPVPADWFNAIISTCLYAVACVYAGGCVCVLACIISPQILCLCACACAWVWGVIRVAHIVILFSTGIIGVDKSTQKFEQQITYIKSE